ncbi:hypothetical protein EV702DRAFT_1050817 [Suillus placidus]|uniref:Secreted protein n=1 Tax=Suillus placidus TaxID=48579 RepID=A0A9P6ZH50_9AGAM|nr:hypothetical protein EV702DRAFT_1050817 [Suillus placidus]
MCCSEILWTGFLFYLLMAVCGAQGCTWERTTDSHGLTRHHTSCQFYKRASTLASQRRHDRAKEAVFSNLVPRLGEASSQCQAISAVRYVRDRPILKPIASCRLLKATSMARESCNTSSLPESQHHLEVEKERTNELDVEMGSNLGTIEDFSNSESIESVIRKVYLFVFEF